MQEVGVLMTINKLTSTLILLVVPAFAANPQPGTYLALGDSVAFGMNPLLFPPYSFQTPTSSQFVGFPEAFAKFTNLPATNLVNAACPGETSDSFLDQTKPDLGCNSPRFPGALPFKTSIKPHTVYTISQMEFAKAQLDGNRSINLVTLTIGANDVLAVVPRLQQCTDQACPAAILGPVLSNYARNLNEILTGIRSRYRGTLIVTKYYSPAPALDSITVALNDVMSTVVSQLNGHGSAPIQFADGFTAFKIAALTKGGDACAAGLVIDLPSTTVCDEHPSEKGRDILALIVFLAQLTKH